MYIEYGGGGPRRGYSLLVGVQGRQHLPSLVGWEGDLGKFGKHQGEREARQIRRCRCGHLDAPCKAPSEALEGTRLRSPSWVSSRVTEAQRGGGLTCHCPSSQESCGPCSWAALTPPSPANLRAGPAQDAGRMQGGAEAGLRGCTGLPAPGRRKLLRVSVAGPAPTRDFLFLSGQV